MKKTTIGIALMILLGMTTSCGPVDLASNTGSSEERDYSIFKYKQYTPSDEIVEGSQTALNTLSKYLNCEVTETVDLSFGYQMNNNPVWGSTMSEEDGFLHYEVTEYQEDNVIYFLFKDDTQVVEATLNESGFNEEGKVTVNPDMFASGKGAYAWYDSENKSANCLINEEGLYCCTSIWAKNTNTGDMVMLWNNTNSPIWEHYFEQLNQ